jgi:hypothetical protein
MTYTQGMLYFSLELVTPQRTMDSLCVNFILSCIRIYNGVSRYCVVNVHVKATALDLRTAYVGFTQDHIIIKSI